MERLKRVLECDAVRSLFRGAVGRGQTLLQYPTEFQGQQTHEHMATCLRVLPDKDGPHLQQTRFQGTQVLFDVGKVFVAVMDGF